MAANARTSAAACSRNMLRARMKMNGQISDRAASQNPIRTKLIFAGSAAEVEGGEPLFDQWIGRQRTARTKIVPSASGTTHTTSPPETPCRVRRPWPEDLRAALQMSAAACQAASLEQERNRIADTVDPICAAARCGEPRNRPHPARNRTEQDAGLDRERDDGDNQNANAPLAVEPIDAHRDLARTTPASSAIKNTIAEMPIAWP